MAYPIKRETFKNGDLALYRHGAANEVASVVIVRCSYFCPAFDDNPEQSKYTVRLDGDIQPLDPKFSDAFPLIHGVDLKDLEPRTASANYGLNASLWDLKVAAIVAKYRAIEAEEKYMSAVENVVKYGTIVPGSRVDWYADPSCQKTLSSIVSKVDLLRGFCIVEDGLDVSLKNLISWQ
jgi:hypothetical protein